MFQFRNGRQFTPLRQIGKELCPAGHLRRHHRIIQRRLDVTRRLTDHAKKFTEIAHAFGQGRFKLSQSSFILIVLFAQAIAAAIFISQFPPGLSQQIVLVVAFPHKLRLTLLVDLCFRIYRVANDACQFFQGLRACGRTYDTE